MAPLYFRGSNFSLNFFKGIYDNKIDSLLKDFFKFFAIKFHVPSAVFNATLQVKPSVIIT